ncbi:VPLPA-CTERM sorting domain-containing protein [Methylomonas montana]|nr:VPLPA-CTERM sorting domain-containing protein [Methylomonas montana]WKJ92137.1 VPLPA-CTERM sorting domain-containing protein [Methylomonas montana]
MAYDNHYASFTVNGFSGYAVTAPVPVPAAVWLFASALAGLGAVSRRSVA